MMTATQSHRPASSKLFPSILALLLLTSCSLYQGKLNTANEPKLNPNPKERYDFTVTLIEAPTNLVVTNIWAIYESNCEQLVDKWAGAYKELTKEFALEFHKIKPNVYQATIFGDKLVDESRPDGMECRWKLLSVPVRLEPSPNLADIHYSSGVGISPNHYVSEGYWKRDGYITRYRFNEPNNKGHFSLSAVISKNMFGPIQKQQLATIRVELRRK
ncbi:hypothetical protein [uncultured Campylobacter sp.]|jgi:hypothetical protein|uniref:hypothetical protein n=1 Tax=Kingella oralis TaxID=505 RepID=UPI00261BDA26|nr:hypothetical protein [uncultured Campylobacter sp.]